MSKSSKQWLKGKRRFYQQLEKYAQEQIDEHFNGLTCYVEDESFSDYLEDVHNDLFDPHLNDPDSPYYLDYLYDYNFFDERYEDYIHELDTFNNLSPLVIGGFYKHGNKTYQYVKIGTYKCLIDVLTGHEASIPANKLERA